LQAEYYDYVRLPEAMPFYSSGTETGFDSLLVNFTNEELLRKIRQFLDPRKSKAAIASEFSVGEGTGGKLLDMRTKFRSDFESNGSGYCLRGMYRVFDTRSYYYKKEYLKTNSLKVMRHLIEVNNVALIAFRQQSQDGFQHVFVTNQLGDKNAVSLRTREINYYFPLRLQPNRDAFRSQANPSPNFSPDFLKILSDALGTERTAGDGLPRGVTPDDIFQYAYATLHSVGYRTRYAELLRIDFPRLPVTRNLDLFRALARLGGELVAIHVMESAKLSESLSEPLAAYTGTADPEVKKISYVRNTVWLDKDQTCGFKGVCEVLWNFHIGGYQVCEKWLKDRRGRILSKDDIAHYQKIIVALSETIRIMTEIDKLIDAHGGWPGAFTGFASGGNQSPASPESEANGN
jgi:hypothetical protein